MAICFTIFYQTTRCYTNRHFANSKLVLYLSTFPTFPTFHAFPTFPTFPTFPMFPTFPNFPTFSSNEKVDKKWITVYAYGRQNVNPLFHSLATREKVDWSIRKMEKVGKLGKVKKLETWEKLKCKQQGTENYHW